MLFSSKDPYPEHIQSLEDRLKKPIKKVAIDCVCVDRQAYSCTVGSHWQTDAFRFGPLSHAPAHCFSWFSGWSLCKFVVVLLVVVHLFRERT